MQPQLDFDPASSFLRIYQKHRTTNWSLPANTWWENSSVEMTARSFHGTKPENCRFIYQSSKATQTTEKHLHSVSQQTSNPECHKLRTPKTKTISALTNHKQPPLYPIFIKCPPLSKIFLLLWSSYPGHQRRKGKEAQIKKHRNEIQEKQRKGRQWASNQILPKPPL